MDFTLSNPNPSGAKIKVMSSGERSIGRNLLDTDLKGNISVKITE